MGEARDETLARVVTSFREWAAVHRNSGNYLRASAIDDIRVCLEEALATQPDAVPELPPYVTEEPNGDWRVTARDGRHYWIYGLSTPDDLDRISEAARILAARERARRAGS